MKIGEHTVVTMAHVLKDGGGDVLDASEAATPLSFVTGRGEILPALEVALLGMEAGQQRPVTLSPADGYGDREEEAVHVVPETAFPPDLALEAGMVLYTKSPAGEVVPITVAAVGTEGVTVDLNHPLAGKTLHFEVRIEDVRAATLTEESRRLPGRAGPEPPGH